MLIGDIRYKYTAKDMAEEQGISHYVIPRLQGQSAHMEEISFTLMTLTRSFVITKSEMIR